MATVPSKIKSLARAHTETAINVLAGIMNQPDSPPAARVTAASCLLDRGWGKPTQPLSGDDEMPGISFVVGAKESVGTKFDRITNSTAEVTASE